MSGIIKSNCLNCCAIQTNYSLSQKDEVLSGIGHRAYLTFLRSAINQVWTNLIHNALQAMNNCGVLTVDVKVENQSLLVGVTDSGKGIAREILPRIFEPFFTTKPPGEGSGLGLDIVKKIVEKHSSNIEVTSAIGQTTFIVSIPIAV